MLIEKLTTNNIRILTIYFLQIYPEWKVLDLFVVEILQSSLGLDSTNRTRPMTHYVESPDYIEMLFDNIAYSKCEC